MDKLTPLGFDFSKNNGSNHWEQFLFNIHAIFSDYTFREERNIRDIYNDSDITKSNLKQFLYKLSQHKIDGHDIIKDAEIDDLKLKDLNEVLQSVTKKPKLSIISNKLEVRGEFVKLSEGLFAKKHENEIKIIQIFALNKIFIDVDLQKESDELVVAIIAPTWEIIGENRAIILDGNPGAELNPSSAILGENGLPGMPGDNGGRFLGVVEKFINGKALVITANGGLGGAGQNGGDGMPGHNGKDAELPLSTESCEDIVKTYRYTRLSDNKYKFHGDEGGKGEKGGDGGVGGIGGSSGDVRIYNLGDDASGVSIFKDAGKVGKGGNGGRGGKGGTHGVTKVVTCTGNKSFEGNTTWNNGMAEFGELGCNNCNIYGRQNPKAASVIQKPAFIINEYKSYVRENIRSNIRSEFLIRFYNLLEINPDINKLYDLSGIENDFQNLEGQSDVLHKKFDFLPFYQFLLKRIEFAKMVEEQKNDIKALEHLEAKLASKIEIEKTLKLLKDGEEKMKLSEYTKAVLVLGNTGAGKSTLTLFLTGAELESVKRGTYLIKDMNEKKISINSTIKSKTVFPELMVDTKTSTAFFDCPGFSDTRSTSIDIASTYFNKKVADSLQSVKIIFVVNHTSLIKGNDRLDFIRFIKHATDLIKDIEKFRNSIVLIATKVNNNYHCEDGACVLESDSEVITGITDFLEETKEVLKEELGHFYVSLKKKEFNANSINFIDILLSRDDQNYTRIGLFRRPNTKGLLSKIPLMQKGKTHIENIVYHKLNFTEKENDDFGYTISEKSKNDIFYLVERIDNNIKFLIREISEEIQLHYKKLVLQINLKINSFTSGNLIIDANPIEARTALDRLKKGHSFASKFVGEVKLFKNADELASKIKVTMTDLNINVSESKITDILTQGKYLNFLEIVHSRKFNSNSLDWVTYFQNILTNFNGSVKDIQNNVSNVEESIMKKLIICVDIAAGNIQLNFRSLIEDINRSVQSLTDETINVDVNIVHVKSLLNNLRIWYNETSHLVLNFQNVKTAEDLANHINITVTNLNVTTAEGNISDIFTHGKYLRYLEIVKDREINIDSSKWVVPFKDILTYIKESKYQLQNCVSDAEVNIDNKIQTNVNEIAERTRKYLHNIIQQMNDVVNSFAVVSDGNLNQSDIVKLSTKFKEGYSKLSHLVKNLQTVTDVTKLANCIKDSLNSLSTSITEGKLAELSKHRKYLTYFEIVINKKIDNNTWKWVAPFQNVLTYISESKQHLQNNITDAKRKIEEKILSNVYTIAAQIHQQFQSLIEHTSFKISSFGNEGADANLNLPNNGSLQINLGKWHKLLSLLVQDLTNVTTPEKLANRIRVSLFSLNITTFEGNISDIYTQGTYLTCLEIVKDTKINIDSSKWESPFRSTLTYITESQHQLQNNVQKAEKRISDDIQSNINAIIAQLEHHIQTIFEHVNAEIKLFVDDKTNASANLTEAGDFSTKLNKVYNIASHLKQNIKSTTNSEGLTNCIKHIETILNKSTIDHRLANISAQIKCLMYLEVESDKDINIDWSKWATPFQYILTYITESKHQLQKNINDVEKQISYRIQSNVKEIASQIQQYLQSLIEHINDAVNFFLDVSCSENINKIDSVSLSTKLKEGSNKLLHLVNNLRNVSDPEELASCINASITSLNIAAVQERISDISKQGNYQVFLEIVNNKKIVNDVWKWAVPFQEGLAFITQSNQQLQNGLILAEREARKKIHSNLNIIAVEIQHYFQELFEYVNFNIKSFGDVATDTSINLVEAENFSTYLKKGYDIILHLVKDLKKVESPDELVNSIDDTISRLNITASEGTISCISAQGKYLTYLANLDGKEISVEAWKWANLFQDISLYITNSKYHLQNGIATAERQIKNKIQSNISNIVLHIKQHFYIITENLKMRVKSFIHVTIDANANRADAEQLAIMLEKDFNDISNLVQDLKKIGNPNEVAKNVNNTITALNITTSKSYLSAILIEGKQLEFLDIVSDTGVIRKSALWGTSFSDVIPHISELTNQIRDVVLNVAEEMNNNIMHNVNQIAEEIIKHYSDKAERTDIQSFVNELSLAYKVFSAVRSKLSNICNTHFLVKEINNSANSLKLEISAVYIVNILNQGTNLQSLDKIGNNKHGLSNSIRGEMSFIRVTGKIVELKSWGNFLVNLYNTFSEYKVQQNIKKYVADTNVFKKELTSESIGHVTKGNFKNFVETIKHHDIYLENILNTEINEQKINDINHILNLTLKHETKAYCESGTLRLRGDYVKLSDVMTYSCLGGIKSLEIYALRKIFINDNYYGAGLNVFMISPIWEVIGNRIIDLNGIDGASHKPAKASNGIHLGNKGEDGRAGLPGGSAGTFVGIGLKIVNGENLKITANGGKGGPGQDGGNGAPGRDGEDAKLPSSDCTINGKTIFKDDGTIFGGGTSVGVYYRDVHRIYGSHGNIGGDGGTGGMGGIGGNSGEIILLFTNGTSKIRNSSVAGNTGRSGSGGYAGAGGKAGNNIIANCHHGKANAMGHDVSWNRWESIKTEKNIMIPSSGKNGIDGLSDRGLLHPKPAFFRSSSDCIYYFKNYIWENIGNRFKRHILTQFQEYIDENSSIKKLYKTIGFVKDLESLEKHHAKLGKEVAILPFYKSMLNRISKYGKHPDVTENYFQYRKVLSYLYTTVLCKIHSQTYNLSPTLILDISKYLEYLKQSVNTLNTLHKENNKNFVINKIKENYKIEIDKRNRECQNLIENMIAPEIDWISDQINNKIYLLVDEIMTLKEKAERETEILIKKKKELERTLELRVVFNIFKAVGQVVSILGPLGTAIGSAIGTVSSIAESLALDDQSSQPRIMQLPASVASDFNLLKDQIKVTKYEKMTLFRKQLEEISNEVNKQQEHFSDISRRIGNIRTRLDKSVNENNSDIGIVGKLENELNEELKRKKAELKLQNVGNDEKYASAVKIMERCTQILQLGVTGIDIYSKYKADKARVDVMSDGIEQAENKITQLNQHKERIYNIVMPMLQNMQDDLNDMADKLGTQSQLTLDVAKWKVQSALRDMRLQILQYTVGFKEEGNISRCIEKLEEAMTTLINLYDRLQNYQHQKHLADCIADISSASANNIQISDSKLRYAVNNLEITIQSNIVLKQYKIAYNAFKQFVFPFVHLYLRNFELPSHLESDGKIENLVLEVSKQIDYLKSKVDEDEASVKDHMQYMRSGYFDSDHHSTKPFYIWKNKKHKNMISKLLSGQKVVVKTLINSSNSDKNAIKFNTVEIKLKSINETKQLKIDNKLKQFEVSMTHFGNSYYKYKDKYFVMASEAVTIDYTFEKMGDGTPVHKNEVYEKLKKGNAVLSPYAMWEIQLRTIQNNISFCQLRQYKDEVDLELVGYGTYVRDNNIPNLMLENYYKAEETVYAVQQNLWGTNVEIDSIFNVMDTSNTNTSNNCHSHGTLSNRKVQNLILQRRFTRGIYNNKNKDAEIKLETTATNSASSLSSPLSMIFNWVKSNFISNHKTYIQLDFEGQSWNNEYEKYSNTKDTQNTNLCFTPSVIIDNFLIFGSYFAAVLAKFCNKDESCKNKNHIVCIPNYKEEILEKIVEYEKNFTLTEMHARKYEWGDN